MKRNVWLQACTLLCATISILTTARALAGPSCDEQFNVIGFTTESEPSFWVAVIRNGDCVSSTLIRVSVHGDSLTGVKKFGYSPSASSWTSSILKQFKHETPIVFSNPSDDWIKLDSGFSIRQPQPSRQLLTRFRQWDSVGIEAWYWNRQEGAAGVDLPRVRGDSLKLVYADSVGLYLRYRLQDVYYYPESGYLVITTANDRYAGEFDSENGFLILRRESAK
jgi:hypothetical protein